MEASVVKESAKWKWRGILSTIGIQVPEDPKKHGPCPICGPGKNAHRFRFDDKDGTGTWICTQCGAGDGLGLVMNAIGLTFQETLELVNEIVGTVEFTVTQKEPQSDDNKRKLLNELWNSSKPLNGSDPASIYLHNRGISLTPQNVRFCENCYESDSKTKMHAMIARVLSHEGKPVTLHRTYIHDGKKADIKNQKKLMPHTGSMVGSSVRLFKHTEVLGVAEGIETAIAATQLFDIPTWSCISSTVLESFRPPDGVRKIVIFGDNDTLFSGQKTAYRLAHELVTKCDVIVEVQIPEFTGMDWADVCRKKL
jgi:putative DNA primase/helicase